MFKFQKKAIGSLGTAVKGRVIPLSQVPDEVFAGEILGKGFAIEPADDTVVSPAHGRIETVAETRHAYTLTTPEGIELLIHIGVDTVGMKGEGFIPRVKEGQTVSRGDPICRADPDMIREKGLSPITSVIVTNSERLEDISLRTGDASPTDTDPVMTYRIRKA